VTAPEEAPTTLYNIANIRYGNDPNPANNRVTVSTYVPLLGYDQLGAVEGLPGRGAPLEAERITDIPRLMSGMS